LNLRPEKHNSLSANKLQKSQEATLPKNCQNPPDLQQIINAWPELPEHIKAAIKTLVQSHKTEEG